MKRILHSSGSFPRYPAESKLLTCESFYGQLDSTLRRSEFARDFLRSMQFRKTGLDEDVVQRKITDGWEGYADFLDWLMNLVSRTQGYDRWLEKTPDHVDYIGDIASHFPEAAIIHMIRDGRDVALSSRKLNWAAPSVPNALFQLLWAGIRWKRFVENGISQATEVSGHRYLEIRFEDLLQKPQETIALVAEHCDLELDVSQLAGFEGNSAFGKTNGLSRTPNARWRRWNNQHELGVLESLIGETLRKTGYDVPERPPPAWWGSTVGRGVTTAVALADFCYETLPSGLTTRKSPLIPDASLAC